MEPQVELDIQKAYLRSTDMVALLTLRYLRFITDLFPEDPTKYRSLRPHSTPATLLWYKFKIKIILHIYIYIRSQTAGLYARLY